MKKTLIALASAAMVFSATSAHAITRPEPTEFNQPVIDESNLGGAEQELTTLLLLGGAAIIGIILAMASSNGNSPT